MNESEAAMMVVSAQRQVLWEEAKGKMRGMYVTQGFGFERQAPHSERQKRFEAMKAKIEGFIEDLEDGGFHE